MSDWIGMSSPRLPRPELKQRVLARALTARRRREGAWPLAAAAALVLAVAVSGLLWRRIAAIENTLAATRDTLNLLRQPGSRVIPIPVVTGTRAGELTIFADSLSQRWLVTCHNLAPNAPGEAYQLWFVTDRGMRAAAVMRMEHDRPMLMTLAMPTDSAKVMGVAMSVEPGFGSTEPTGRILFHVDL